MGTAEARLLFEQEEAPCPFLVRPPPPQASVSSPTRRGGAAGPTLQEKQTAGIVGLLGRRLGDGPEEATIAFQQASHESEKRPSDVQFQLLSAPVDDVVVGQEKLQGGFFHRPVVHCREGPSGWPGKATPKTACASQAVRPSNPEAGDRSGRRNVSQRGGRPRTGWSWGWGVLILKLAVSKEQEVGLWGFRVSGGWGKGGSGGHQGPASLHSLPPPLPEDFNLEWSFSAAATCSWVDFSCQNSPASNALKSEPRISAPRAILKHCGISS